jgi:acrylyl-CoA reductase (NADPH)
MSVPEKFKGLIVKEFGSAAELLDLRADDLPVGEVTIRVRYSSLNYKDGLAVASRARILRSFPCVPGIDLAGTVVESVSHRCRVGDPVVVTGCGIGESSWGGYAQYAQVRSDCIVPLPEGIGLLRAMALGTAGITAMLAVIALGESGVTPKSGEVVVTGAAGGVGSLAVALLAQRGYQVVAVTGRMNEADFIQSLGASEVIDRAGMGVAAKPLERARWAGAIDGAGGPMLARVLAETKYGGSVAAYGLAAGSELHTTVMPFILRAVKLIGINSVDTPMPLRLKAWQSLAAEMPVPKLDYLTTVRPLSDVPALTARILAGKIRGRTVIDLG